MVLAGVALTLSRDAATEHPQVGSRGRPAPPAGVPEHVAYEFLFRRSVFFRERAASAGKPQAVDPTPGREAGLRDEHARALDKIAAACLEEVKAQDERARVVINSYRARYPGRVVPPGQSLPPPPPELEAMQRERDAMLLRGRDRLREALGEKEFARLSEFVMRRFGGRAAHPPDAAACCQ
jgi:hypothetical protein